MSRPSAVAKPAPDLSEARRLLGMGMALVELVPYTKRPIGLEWNKHRATEINPDATGYGIPLAANKLCSIDPDYFEPAVVGLRALGFDLKKIMSAGVRTRSTRPNSGGRSTFAADGEIGWVTFRCKGLGTVLELRADSENLQDCVPGVVYRDKDGNLRTQTYANGRTLDEAPPLPDDFLKWWERCSTDIDFLREQQRIFFEAIGAHYQQPSETVGAYQSISTGKGGGNLAFPAPGIRTEFNRQHQVEDILERHGYRYHKSEDRWSHPAATGAPGTRQIPGREGLWRSDHGGDPLLGNFDAWIAHVVLDHGGDLDAALAAHAPQPPPQELPPVEAYEGDPQANPGEPAAAPIALRPLHEIVAEKREPEWLIEDVIEANVLAVIAGARSTFKSFVALDWAMRIAAGGQAVVILSGEGAGLDRRADAWMRAHAPTADISALPVFALERPLNLNQDADMVALRAGVNRLGQTPAMVVIDTFSKFSAGLDENDNGAVSTYLTRLSEHVRQAFSTTVLLVAHSGHSDPRRPRGASALMANPDAEYIIERPSPIAMTIAVSRERFKDCPALPPLGYEARVIDLGRRDKLGRPVTSLALNTVDVVMPVHKREGGRNQERALIALREYHRANPDSRFLTSVDLSGILSAQGIKDRRRRSEVIAWLVAAGILTNSVGGHVFDPTNL